MGKVKIYGIVAVSLLITGLVIWLILRKKTVYLKDPPNDQPTANSNLTEDESKEVIRLATELYNQLKGYAWDIFFRSPKPYEDLATCSDRIFVGTYNYFNTNFSKGSGTLRTWIEGDWYFSKSRAGASVLLISQRFDRLNLK